MRPRVPPTALTVALVHLGPITAASSQATPPDDAILQRAARNIEQHRKEDVTLAFRTRPRTRLRGCRVQVRQTSHDFLFGNCIRYRHFNDESFQERYNELFNFATLLEFNWFQYEPEEGMTRRDERTAIARWCRQNGIETNGHMLVWTRASGVPEWLNPYDEAKRYSLLQARVKQVVADYAGLIDSWVVVNEPINTRVWGNWAAPEGKKDEPISAIIPYVHDAYVWAHEANPNANLILNEYNIIVSTEQRQRFVELVRELQKRDTPITALGVQAHEPNKGAYWYSPRQLWETYDELAELGYPLYITEFLPQSSGKPILGGNREGTWNEDTQAEFGELFYRVSFGHPAVVCIVWFGMADDDVVYASGGVLDDQHQPKPVFDALKRLIHDEWTTRLSADLPPDGTFAFRGFRGNYDVVVTRGDRELLRTAIHVQQGQPNQWSFDLPNR